MKNEVDFLYEWAIWANLNSKRDLELILLKGHLLLEIIMNTALKRNNIIDFEDDYSFYRKIMLLDKIELEDQIKKDFIISSLKQINKLRNKLAHNFNFDIKNGELELWSSSILENLEGTKFTKYTPKTKIAHSFSIISKNILDIAK